MVSNFSTFTDLLKCSVFWRPRQRLQLWRRRKASVRRRCCPWGVAEAAMAGSRGFDVLLIPGGIGTRNEMANPQFIAGLKRLAEASRIVTTVCTGSLLLARTGLLDGRKSTSNKRVFQLVKGYEQKEECIAKALWMKEGMYYTSSGFIS